MPSCMSLSQRQLQGLQDYACTALGQLLHKGWCGALATSGSTLTAIG